MKTIIIFWLISGYIGIALSLYVITRAFTKSGKLDNTDWDNPGGGWMLVMFLIFWWFYAVGCLIGFVLPRTLDKLADKLNEMTGARR